MAQTRKRRQLLPTKVDKAITLLRGILLLMAASLLGFAAQAQDFPATPAGPVYDGAEILSPAAEAQLDTRLRDYNRTTGRAVIVATVPDLQGATIDSYATALFAAWGIGGEKRDQGLLLLVARDDRKMRIEVGYGLHGYFGGIMAGRIIRDVITPKFKQEDFDGGVTAGVDAILSHLAKSPEDAVAIEEAAQAAEAQRQTDGGFPIGAVIWVGFIMFFFVLPALSGRGRKRRFRSGMGGAVGDIILWEAGKAIARGISDSDDWGGGGGFGGGGFGGGGGGGFGGFGGGMSGGGGASGGW